MKRESEQTQAMGLQELERRVSAILQLSDDDLRKQFVQIAGSETPTQAYERAFDLATEHFDARMAREFAKAVRYLSIIKRDHGLAKFEKIVAEE